MKTLDAEVFPLTNAEVMKILRERGAHRTVQEGSNAAPSEREVAEYLDSVGTPHELPDAKEMAELRDALLGMGLEKREVLQIINTCPSTTVEAYVCVSNAEERGFDVDKMEEIVRLVDPLRVQDVHQVQ